MALNRAGMNTPSGAQERKHYNLLQEAPEQNSLWTTVKFTICQSEKHTIPQTSLPFPFVCGKKILISKLMRNICNELEHVCKRILESEQLFSPEPV